MAGRAAGSPVHRLDNFVNSIYAALILNLFVAPSLRLRGQMLMIALGICVRHQHHEAGAVTHH